MRFRDIVSSISLCILLIHFTKVLFKNNSFNRSIITKLVLYEGENSLTILGTHAIIQTALFMILGYFMNRGCLFYLIVFGVELVLVNICVFVFNKYTPFIVNKKG